MTATNKNNIGYIFYNNDKLKERFELFLSNSDLTSEQVATLINIVEDYGLAKYDQGYSYGSNSD